LTEYLLSLVTISSSEPNPDEQTKKVTLPKIRAANNDVFIFILLLRFIFMRATVRSTVGLIGARSDERKQDFCVMAVRSTLFTKGN